MSMCGFSIIKITNQYQLKKSLIPRVRIDSSDHVIVLPRAKHFQKSRSKRRRHHKIDKQIESRNKIRNCTGVEWPKAHSVIVSEQTDIVNEVIQERENQIYAQYDD